MSEEWLDRNARKVGFAWLACIALGVYIYGGVTAGFGRATVVALQTIGLMVAVFGTLFALVLVAGDD